MANTNQPNINLLDPEVVENPHETFAILRKEAPVFKDPTHGWYVVTRFKDVFEALRNPQVFSNKGLRPDEPYPEVVRIWEEEGSGPPVPVLIHTDPPEHTRYRSLVEGRFGPARVKAMEPYLQELIDDLINSFIDKGQVEFVTQFSIPLPLGVIADQVGVSRNDMDKFKKWSDASVETAGMMASKERAIECAHLRAEFDRYFIDLIEERRAKPQDDILSELVHAEYEDGPPLSTRELLATISQLLVAGNETTTSALSAAMHMLATNPELAEQLRQEPRLSKTFVEEVLRLESPVQGLFRITTQDTELGGVKIPRQSMVHLRFGSANRDESQFECPAKLDVQRPKASRHLVFGGGIHHCIGSYLARTELQFSVRRILERMDRIRLKNPDEHVRHHPHFFLRGIERLELEFDAR